MLASVVVYGRVLVELSAVAAESLPLMIAPLGAMVAVTASLALIVLIRRKPDDGAIPQQQNPTNLKAALFFAAIYAAVVLASAAARERLGSSGLYAVAALSGLSDMDAITLSSGRAVTEGRTSADVAWRAIVIALMSSMVMKVLICAVLGNRKLFARAALLFSTRTPCRNAPLPAALARSPAPRRQRNPGPWRQRRRPDPDAAARRV
jgi:uncharacterized membrane protein (DUF4010 family)